MFVHDFVSIGQPAGEVTTALVRRVEPTLSALLSTVWASGHDVRSQLGVPQLGTATLWQVQVWLGSPRLRPDAVVIPLSWHGDDQHPELPTLEADLEIASWTDETTHLHLLGHYHLPARMSPWSSEASLAHRAMVVVVRRFLELLADELANAVTAAAEEARPPPDTACD